ncbi:ferredoxin--NADP reductase [Sedimenticola sp.]|uniref:ferredoxin--NADP reductase n=1 Tax=Sedimenticola sp. TaxID=1940285 RepID=UPI00258E4E4C|nr:ferredoxin--NADP reductase [Sedimenticola sp.]MCW8905334.1 ferredoxin--NADP reductase [Sedimenticola sp.]
MKTSKFSYNATVSRCIEVTGEIRILQVRLDQPGFKFNAGQYTMLGLLQDEPRIPEAQPEDNGAEPGGDPMIRRAYSIASGSTQQEYLEFYVSIVSSGALTPRLFALQEGDRLYVAEKSKGLFTLDRVPVESNVLLVGTGTGLAPYVSMLRSEVLANRDRRIAVLHGASFSWDLGYRRELESLSLYNDHFSYIPTISRPHVDKDWQGFTGRLPPFLDDPTLEELCGFALEPGPSHVLLCGNPAMIEDATVRLEARGYQQKRPREPGNLHMEKYW